MKRVLMVLLGVMAAWQVSVADYVIIKYNAKKEGNTFSFECSVKTHGTKISNGKLKTLENGCSYAMQGSYDFCAIAGLQNLQFAEYYSEDGNFVYSYAPKEAEAYGFVEYDCFDW